jgi:hypothetical protein
MKAVVENCQNQLASHPPDKNIPNPFTVKVCFTVVTGKNAVIALKGEQFFK